MPAENSMVKLGQMDEEEREIIMFCADKSEQERCELLLKNISTIPLKV